jgi:SAM-dependent methyltransferase
MQHVQMSNDPVGGLGRLGRRLRFRWNPSAYYHTWLLSQIPPSANTALDVGCGDGRFARRLAAHGLEVDAIDRDRRMIDTARAIPASGVRWIHANVLAPEGPLRGDGYDVVVVIAALHFIPSQQAFARLRPLVRPRGTLLVVGLYRGGGAPDAIMSLLMLPFHLGIGAYRSRRGDAFVRYDPDMAMVAPPESLREIRAAAAATLPGARVRRRAFWRYTLEWQPSESVSR